MNHLILFTTPPAPLGVCLAKSDSREKLNQKSQAGDVSLNVVDINDDDAVRRYEGGKNTSANLSPPLSSSSRSSSISRDRSPQKLDTSLTPSSILSITSKTDSLFVSNWTDDEKCKRQFTHTLFNDLQLAQRPYFEALISALDCTENDQKCFYSLSLIFTMCNNPYSNIRLVTLDLTITILKSLVYDEQKCSIRVFSLIRALSLKLNSTLETLLPKDRQFLVTNPMQFILIEPDVKRLGWSIGGLSTQGRE
ncbi:unnamed protein product [Didymodactylos carnosus]|uniref:Uncharacterized protein n=1 Tax=Didymodactylos carnosus TaxID=1234261 RepID=A0A814XZ77_9BILA|nr:unnamed protein product [Didymodactylos carnosus]CAF3985520.1 unnamed protein product [Didymodactylos carnosus]